MAKQKKLPLPKDPPRRDKPGAKPAAPVRPPQPEPVKAAPAKAAEPVKAAAPPKVAEPVKAAEPEAPAPRSPSPAIWHRDDGGHGASEPAPPPPAAPAHHDDDLHLDAVPHSHAGRYILIVLGLLAAAGVIALVISARQVPTKGQGEGTNKAIEAAKADAATARVDGATVPAADAATAAPSDGGAAVAVADLAQAPVPDLATPPDLAPAAAPAPDDGGVAAAVPLTPEQEVEYKRTIKRAQRLLDNDNIDEAIPLFKRALEIKPNGSEALFGLACARLDVNESEAARIANKALKVDESYAEAYIAKGAIAQRRHRLKQARTNYRRYLLLAPNGKYAAEIRTILENLK